MKKRIFDFGMFSDALRRTALIGGIITALTVISVVISFAGSILFSASNNGIVAMGFSEINPMILVIPFLAVPILTMNLFGFLNKRSTSDFWHSVPFTRECIFVSFYLAVFAWVVFATAISTVASVILYSLVPNLFAIDLSSLFFGIISILVISLLIEGGFLIAMSITGTVFNNIVVALIILFMPRLLLLVLDIMQTNGYLFGSSTLFLDGKIPLNMLFSMVVSVFFGYATAIFPYTTADVFASVPAILYTLLLSAIYFAVGIICFKKRKSEAASNSTVSPTVQTAIRTLVSFVICLIPIYMIISEWHSKHTSFTTDDLFTIAVLYLVAVIAYFIYELISTKKAKNMLKAIPSIWVLAALNLVFIFCAHLGYIHSYNFTPTADTISAVKFVSGNSVYSYEYFDAAVSKISITDDNIEKLLCDAYEETREKYEKRDYRADQTITVGFKTQSGYKYRTVMMSNELYSLVNNHLESTQEFKDIYDVDKLFDESIFVSAHIHYVGNLNNMTNELSDDQQKLIIESFKEEIRAMNLNDWRTLTKTYNTLYDENGDGRFGFMIGAISGSKKIGSKAYYYDVTITNHTPKTYKLVMDIIFEKQKESNAQREALDLAKEISFTDDPTDYKTQYISVNLYNGINMNEDEYYEITNTENLKEMLSILESTVGKVPDARSRIAVFSVENYEYMGYDENMYKRAIFYIPDEADLTFLLNDNFYDGGLEGEGSEEIKDEYYTGDYSVIEGNDEDNDNDTSSKVGNSSSSVNDSSSKVDDTSSQSQSAA